MHSFDTTVVYPVEEIIPPPVVDAPYVVESVPAELYPGEESIPAQVHPGDELLPAELHPDYGLIPPQSYPAPRPSGPIYGEPAIVMIDSMLILNGADDYQTEIGQLQEGVSYLFIGRVLPNAYRFSINFICDNGNIALHINPRFDTRDVIRNSQIRGSWGREEKHMALPFLFQQGEQFAIEVLVTKHCYLMSFNGYHFDFYVHRLPFDRVRFLKVNGDAEDLRIHCTQVRGYPHSQVQVPPPSPAYYDVMPMRHFADDIANVDVLSEGDSFLFTGQIDAKCKEFQLNFICANDARDIALHIKCQFKQNRVVRNSRMNGSWNREEAYTPIPFRKGERFAIQVLVTSDSYLIAVNGQHYAQYRHRVPYLAVASMEVTGEVFDVQTHRTTVRGYPQNTLQRQMIGQL